MHGVHALPMRAEHVDGVLGLRERQRIRVPLLERIASGLDDVDLCSPRYRADRLRLSREWRKSEVERENDREPDSRMGTSVGWLAGV
jgi:hypothetical protein